MLAPVTWFADSPDAGDPKCLCSFCYDLITEEQAPAIRVFDTEKNLEARFHQECYLRWQRGENASANGYN